MKFDRDFRTCTLCEKSFSRDEINDGTLLLHLDNSRIHLVRFPDGLIHQFLIGPIGKKSAKPLRGAIVAPPPASDAPLTEAPVEQPPQPSQNVETPGVEEMAEALINHSNSEPYHAASIEIPEPANHADKTDDKALSTRDAARRLFADIRKLAQPSADTTTNKEKIRVLPLDATSEQLKNATPAELKSFLQRKQGRGRR
jgi:hypothetical protein